MKTILVLLLMACSIMATADEPLDSAGASKMFNDGRTKTVKEISDTLKAILKAPKAEASKTKHADTLSVVLSFLPVLFFLFSLILVVSKLNASDKPVGKFLTDKEQQVAIFKEKIKTRVADANVRAELAKAAAENPKVLEVAPNISNPVTPEPSLPE